ncbi:MAG: enoyl-CoA hydratase/isomerase family protein [Rhizobiaceae bacterium]|nr:enoyl-CoA hydratase/isomerase family protein [Rhizobiaceae bacterium]
MMKIEDFEFLRVDVADRVATITLNRPELLNAVNGEMHRELKYVFRAIADDLASDVVILTGAGRGFCSGGDLDWLQHMVDNEGSFNSIIEEAKAVVFSMLEMPKPMICRMNGDAIGLGATLAVCCDMVVADENARFGDPHVRAGLVAGDGAAILLPMIVGHLRAKEILLTGSILSAREAQAIGLINHVVPTEELDERVALLTERLLNGATQAIRFTKIALNRMLRKAAQDQMDVLMAYEALSSRTRDHAEAVAAFREKRKPKFTGG